MFGFNIITLPHFSINNKTIDTILFCISNIVKNKQNWTINIVFLDRDSIKKLNNKYRKVNKTTDVLSFHYFNNFDKLKRSEIAWEIVLNEEKIIKQAIEYKLWIEKEFYKLLIHSILHILWFNHEKEEDYKIMNTFENIIWLEVFEK